MIFDIEGSIVGSYNDDEFVATSDSSIMSNRANKTQCSCDNCDHTDCRCKVDKIGSAAAKPDKIGGAIKYGLDRESPAQKDKVVAQLVPQNISECALYLSKAPNEPCSSDKTITSIGNIVGESNPEHIISTAKKQLSCDTEKCVLNKLESKLGKEIVIGELMSNFKVKGPLDVSLMSNVHIDSTLKQWARRYKDFFPYNFNMLNYASYSIRDNRVINEPDSLATINFAELLNQNFKCAGCIINTDVYQGAGKHWMALFVDTRGTPPTIEFFNSSGNPPAPEWVSWMVKTRTQLEQAKATNPELIKVTSIRHQQSRTECGLYSLFYIWARLNGIPYTYFLNVPVPDQIMFEFRHHLFDDPSRASPSVFNYDAWKKTVNIKWE